MNIRLDQKRALITGSSSGIGEAIALGLADAGAKVAINYHTHPEAGQLLVHRIKDQHDEAIALQADVSDPEAIAQMFGRIDQAWGGIDILINNAGIDGDRAFRMGDRYRGVAKSDRGESVRCVLLRPRGSEAHGAAEKRRRAEYQFGARTNRLVGSQRLHRQ